MTMKPSELLPNDHFLSKVVEHALFTMNKCYQYNWDSNYVMLNLDDPFRQQKSTSARPVSEEFDTGKFSHVADAERQLSRTTSIRTFNNTLSISGAGTVTTSKPTTIRKANADSAQEFFGVLLSQIFLILSVLSKGDDLLTLPVASNLHHLPSIGHGTSFVVRKVPREYISGLPDSLLQAERFFVYKSLRHYNRKPGDEQDADGRATRLKTILLEIQVLTHSPLRSHDNIVRLIGFGWETNRIDPHSHVFQWPFLVLEYALYGSMVDAFERHAMDYSTRQNMCIDVGQGLLALHKCEVVHGDIKMENILVFPHRDKGFVAKLADFGCTLLNSEENAPRRQLPGYTKPWNAPEYLKRMSREELPLTDIYSYGLLVWRTMCYGHAPFTENQGLLPFNKHEWIAKLKDEDQLLVVALRSLKLLEPFGDFVDDINGALENSLQLDPAKRCLVSCIRALGGQVLPCSDAPLKQVAIPSEALEFTNMITTIFDFVASYGMP
ncbi:kinase-like domain-containing protein [Crassisporium funariophilum]|nr:kinase-like domain-containing protein [Crassisporium funariophilum]